MAVWVYQGESSNLALLGGYDMPAIEPDCFITKKKLVSNELVNRENFEFIEELPNITQSINPLDISPTFLLTLNIQVSSTPAYIRVFYDVDGLATYKLLLFELTGENSQIFILEDTNFTTEINFEVFQFTPGSKYSLYMNYYGGSAEIQDTPQDVNLISPSPLPVDILTTLSATGTWLDVNIAGGGGSGGPVTNFDDLLTKIFTSYSTQLASNKKIVEFVTRIIGPPPY